MNQNYNQPKGTALKPAPKTTLAKNFFSENSNESEILNTHFQAFADDAKSLNIEVTLPQLISRVRTIVNNDTKDDTTIEAAIEAAKLSLIRGVEASEVCIISNKPSLTKPALLKLANRVFQQNGAAVSYEIQFYGASGEHTNDKNIIDSANCTIVARIGTRASGVFAGFAGEILRYEGMKVFWDRYSGFNKHDKRGVLTDMALRSVIRTYFPEVLGGAEFTDEVEYKNVINQNQTEPVTPLLSSSELLADDDEPETTAKTIIVEGPITHTAHEPEADPEDDEPIQFEGVI
jgi:hypothetical protein